MKRANDKMPKAPPAPTEDINFLQADLSKCAKHGDYYMASWSSKSFEDGSIRIEGSLCVCCMLENAEKLRLAEEEILELRKENSSFPTEAAYQGLMVRALNAEEARDKYKAERDSLAYEWFDPDEVASICGVRDAYKAEKEIAEAKLAQLENAVMDHEVAKWGASPVESDVDRDLYDLVGPREEG